MTVSSTSYTTNSIKVTVNNELGSTDIMTAVDTAITSLGWTQYDVVDVTTFSPIKTFVYRVINVDTSTYKYFILRFDTVKLIMYTSTCESWNTTTNIATNECWNGGGAFPQYYDIKDSFIFVSATARHILVWPFIRNEPGMWAGVFEFERIAAEDTAGNNVPCWAWTNSLMIGTPHGNQSGYQSDYMYAFPRTADGSTGAYAASDMAPVTNRGMFPPSYPTYGRINRDDGNMLHLGSYFRMTYSWDTNKTVISPVAAEGLDNSMSVGRTYNVGVTKSLGSFLDTTYVNIDSTGGWPSYAGSNTECILLPMNGGCEASAAYGAGQVQSPISSAAVTTYKSIGIGGTMFGACSDGIRSWTMDSGANTATTLVASVGTTFDIVFDGADYIYGSNNTHINRYQVSNGALTSLAVTGGTYHLSLDNKYIYAAGATAATTPKINIIPRSTFASVTSNTLSVSATASSYFGIPKPDYTGYVHVTTHPTFQASQIQKLATYNSDTAVQTNIVSDPVYAGVANSTATFSALYIDNQTNRFYFAKLIPSITSTQYSRIYELSNTFATISNSLQYGVGIPTNSILNQNNTDLVANSTASNWSTLDHSKELVMIPRRGLFYMSPQYTSASITTNASGVAGIFFLQWKDATTPAYPIRFTPSPTPALSPFGYSHYYQTTNGPRTFLAGGAMSYTKNWYNTTSVSGFATGRLTLKG